jgi:hypothetical protein
MAIQDMVDVERARTHGILHPEVGIFRNSKLTNSTQDGTIFVAVDYAGISSCVVGDLRSWMCLSRIDVR